MSLSSPFSFTVYVTACHLKKSFIFNAVVKIIRYMHCPIRYIFRGRYRIRKASDSGSGLQGLSRSHGHSIGHNDFPLVFNRNYVSVSYRFQDIIIYFQKFKEAT